MGVYLREESKDGEGVRVYVKEGLVKDFRSLVGRRDD